MHFKRFDNTGKKISKHISFLERLDLSKVLTKDGCLYELQAIIVHSGRFLAFGHYYSYVRSDSTWFKVSREGVTGIDKRP